MDKNIYMTPVEQKIMEAVASREIVANREISDLLPDLDKKIIDWWCHNLSKKAISTA